MRQRSLYRPGKCIQDEQISTESVISTNLHYKINNAVTKEKMTPTPKLACPMRKAFSEQLPEWNRAQGPVAPAYPLDKPSSSRHARLQNSPPPHLPQLPRSPPEFLRDLRTSLAETLTGRNAGAWLSFPSALALAVSGVGPQ